MKEYPFFVDPSESPKAELGSGFVQSYLGNGMLSKGFAVATERRVYFKGKSYFKDFKGRWKKQMQEKTVDLKDITGTGYTSMRQSWAMVAAIVSLAWPWLLSIPVILLGGIFSLPEGDEWVLFFLMSVLPALVLLAVWHFKRNTLFVIEFAGGSISFNTSWYSKEEVDNFQKSVRQAMAAVKDNETPVPAAAAYAAPMAATDAVKEKAQVLRQYAKLKEDGIISQEEFQKMKAELMPGRK